MSESSDFDPGPWKGHDFNTARKAYDDHAGRSYSQAVNSGKSKKDLIPDGLTSNASIPLVIISDVTGSMGADPSVFFSKLGYLDLEVQEYLGKDAEICFCATGDANSDSYPIQITEFAQGLKLKEQLKKLVIEGNGGGQKMETYELLALYFARKVKTPKAIRKPIIIFIGDEAPYAQVNLAQAKDLLGINTRNPITTANLFMELKRNWEVYLIRRPYGDYRYLENMDGTNRKIYEAWRELLGDDHIVSLPSAERVVDVIFGILAEETSRQEYFDDELATRQLKDKDGDKKVAVVQKALKTIRRTDNPLALTGPDVNDSDASRSVTRHTSSGTTPPRGKKLI